MSTRRTLPGLSPRRQADENVPEDTDGAAAVAAQQRLDAIKKAVAAGTYRISSEEIAEKLIKVMRDR